MSVINFTKNEITDLINGLCCGIDSEDALIDAYTVELYRTKSGRIGNRIAKENKPEMAKVKRRIKRWNRLAKKLEQAKMGKVPCSYQKQKA